MTELPGTRLAVKHIDVLIICALKDEYDQVVNVNEGIISDGWIETIGETGRIISVATFQSNCGHPLTIQATWVAYMGREQAITTASSLINSNRVSCIAMTGICAGRRGEVNLGDVIFADRLWSYDSGKEVVEDGVKIFKGDMLQYRPSELWVQRMQRFSISTEKWAAVRPELPLENQEDWVLVRLVNNESPISHPESQVRCPDWQETLERIIKKGWVDERLNLTPSGQVQARKLLIKYPLELPQASDFSIHVAPIATGAAVIEDESIFSHLSSSMRKVLGIDMEASAIAALGEIHDVPVIVVKAVSDFGDKFKDNRYRIFGAHASAQCLIAFLRTNSDLLRSENKPLSGQMSEASSYANISSYSVEQLIKELAEEYPDIGDARALWKRAGGKAYEIENIARPRDLWQRIWQKSTLGANVTPLALLSAVEIDLPNNNVILFFLAQYRN